MSLDLDKTTSIMLVGKCGTGKTRTIKEIVRQAKAGYSNLDVLYVDDHTADFDTVKDIAGYLLNDSTNMTESELRSLYSVVKTQQEFRNQLVCDIAYSIVCFGRVAHQSIVLTTQRLSQHREYGDIYSLASVRVYFHSGLDDKDEYELLFGRELPRDARRGDVTFVTPFSTPIKDGGVVSKLWESMDEVLGEHELEDFSLSDIKMLSQILKRKVPYLNKMFERRILHIIEVTRELDFSDCKDMDISWHIIGQDITVSILIHQLQSDYVISAKMLNMPDEDLVKNKDLCKYIG